MDYSFLSSIAEDGSGGFSLLDGTEGSMGLTEGLGSSGGFNFGNFSLMGGGQTDTYSIDGLQGLIGLIKLLKNGAKEKRNEYGGIEKPMGAKNLFPAATVNNPYSLRYMDLDEHSDLSKTFGRNVAAAIKYLFMS